MVTWECRACPAIRADLAFSIPGHKFEICGTGIEFFEQKPNCPECGRVATAWEKHCPKCGNEMVQDTWDHFSGDWSWEFWSCNECGEAIDIGKFQRRE